MKDHGLIKMFVIQWMEERYEMCAHKDDTSTTIGGTAWIAPNPLPVDVRPFVAWIVNSFWEQFPTNNPIIPLIAWAHQFEEISDEARTIVRLNPLLEKQFSQWKEDDLSRWPS